MKSYFYSLLNAMNIIMDMVNDERTSDEWNEFIEENEYNEIYLTYNHMEKIAKKFYTLLNRSNHGLVVNSDKWEFSRTNGELINAMTTIAGYNKVHKFYDVFLKTKKDLHAGLQILNEKNTSILVDKFFELWNKYGAKGYEVEPGVVIGKQHK